MVLKASAEPKPEVESSKNRTFGEETSSTRRLHPLHHLTLAVPIAVYLSCLLIISKTKVIWEKGLSFTHISCERCCKPRICGDPLPNITPRYPLLLLILHFRVPDLVASFDANAVCLIPDRTCAISLRPIALRLLSEPFFQKLVLDFVRQFRGDKNLVSPLGTEISVWCEEVVYLAD
jgi:hypothetical protein